MATIVCQQQGSCLDSQLVEPRATLRLKLSSLSSIATHFEPSQQKCHFGHNKDQTTIKTTTTTTNSINASSLNKGGWSFLQSLSSCSQISKPNAEETTYVHPLNKRSSSTILSERSLELCTENLGNETGTTDTFDCGIFSSTWCASSKPGCDGAAVTGGQAREMGSRRLAAKKARETPRSFPPPLTTISGKDSIQVKRHREDGRLIIKAVKGQSRLVSCFKADRSEEGRLRLCLLENYSPNLVSQENERESFQNDAKEAEGGGGGGKEQVEEEGESEKEKSEMVKIEKFGMVRGGRCKEGGEQQYIVENKSVLNWERFWVAT